MPEVVRQWGCARLAVAVLLLASCDSKQTGGNREPLPNVPDVATPPPPAVVASGTAGIDLGFAATDANRDGNVSSAEYAASSTRLFGAMDGDEDGSLTVAELDAARTDMRIASGPSSEKLIERADNDGDLKLTLAEFVGDTNGRFAAADMNSDGQLSEDEFYAGHSEVSRESTGATPAPSPSASPTRSAPP